MDIIKTATIIKAINKNDRLQLPQTIRRNSKQRL